MNEYFILVATGRWVNREKPDYTIDLSLVYKLRFSDKIAVRLSATPEAAKKDENILISSADTAFLNIPQTDIRTKDYTIQWICPGKLQ